MEELLASQSQKITTLSRGQQVEGEIVSKSNKELTLDLGTKSEGIIATRDIPQDQLDSLKVGNKFKAYVILPENESGQVVLALHQPQVPQNLRRRGINWTKFTALKNQKSNLNGKVVEINKGGLMIEVDKFRGFLPNSQVGFELMSKVGKEVSDLVGQTITVTVIEVDEENNKLIFSQRGKISEDLLKRLKNIKSSQKVTGKIVAMLPFGLVVDVDGVEGLVFISDVAWEKVEDLSSTFSVGQQIEAQVLGVDEQLGRVNLSIKHLTEDPFQKLAEKYRSDEVIKGEVTEVTEAGVIIKLEDPSGELGTSGVEGFLPPSKMDPDTQYEVGKSVTLLVDSVDSPRRRINLAPFITTTKGLIYK